MALTDHVVTCQPVQSYPKRDSTLSRTLNSIGITAVFLMVIYYGLLFSCLNFQRYDNFDPTLFDPIAFNMYWNTAEGNFLDYSGNSMPNFSSNMALLHPTLILLSGLYAVFPEPRLILALEAWAIALSILVVFALARQKLNGFLLPAALALSFGLNPWANYYSMLGNPLFALGTFFGLTALLFLRLRRMVPFIFAVLLACAQRPDFVALHFLLGIYLWRMERDRRFGLALVRITLIWVAAFLIGAFFSQGDLFVEASNTFRLGALGDSLGDIVKNIFFHTDVLLINIFILENVKNLLFLAPVCFLPLLSPRWLLPLALEVVYVALSTKGLIERQDFVNFRSLFNGAFHLPYNSGFCILMPLVILAAIEGAHSLTTWLGTRLKGKEEWIRPALAVTIAAGSILFHYWFTTPITGPVPWSREFNWNYYTVTDHARIGHRLIERIPEGASVIFSETLTHRDLYNRANMAQRIDYKEPCNPISHRYVLFDLFSYTAHETRDSCLDSIAAYVRSKRYGVLEFIDGYILMEAGADRGANNVVLEYIEEHRTELERNVFNPYLFGADGLDSTGRPFPVHSVTQLIGDGQSTTATRQKGGLADSRDNL